MIAVFTEQDLSINDLKVSNDGSFLFSASGVMKFFYSIVIFILYFTFQNSLFVFNLKKQNLKSKKHLAPKALLNSFDISREGDVSITGQKYSFL